MQDSGTDFWGTVDGRNKEKWQTKNIIKNMDDEKNNIKMMMNEMAGFVYNRPKWIKNMQFFGPIISYKKNKSGRW